MVTKNMAENKIKQIKGQRYKEIKSPYGIIYELIGKDKTKLGKLLQHGRK